MNSATNQSTSKTQTTQGQGELKRGLKSRHLTMISLGGTIGTGLFLASGGVIHTDLVANCIRRNWNYGLFLMTSLAELAAYMPVTGSFSTYATKFVDPSLGFDGTIGITGHYDAELAAVTLIMKFWFPDTPSLIWSGLCLAIIFLLNYLSVKGFGESEYWFALIKVVTIIIFLIVGFMMIFGIMGGERLALKLHCCRCTI